MNILAQRGVLVRWEDFMGADSWEPYAGLRHAEKLDEYLRVHKISSIQIFLPNFFSSGRFWQVVI